VNVSFATLKVTMIATLLSITFNGLSKVVTSLKSTSHVIHWLHLVQLMLHWPSSSTLFVDRGEDRCCGLSKVGMVEIVGFRQVMWLVKLESAEDRIIGVDTLGQHVPPRVRYGTTCLLISYAMGCVSCSVEWGWHHILWSYFVTYFVTCLNYVVQEGTFVLETLAL
jgi:hypothetical protein